MYLHLNITVLNLKTEYILILKNSKVFFNQDKGSNIVKGLAENWSLRVLMGIKIY